jgi:hypothetical protein
MDVAAVAAADQSRPCQFPTPFEADADGDSSGSRAPGREGNFFW